MGNVVAFQVNYYVGAMLVQAGELRIDDMRINFQPTGMIEKMMGAKEVVIALAEILAYEYTGGLSRTVRIRTKDQVHKFEGSATSDFGDVLLKLLPSKAVRKPSKVQAMYPYIGPKYSCAECTFVSQPGLQFCPRCGIRPKGTCQKCERLLDIDWIFCGYCGTKVGASSNSLQQRRAG